MVRSFLPPGRWGEGKVVLSGEEAHHLARVLRVRPGEAVTLFDGQGREANAKVARVEAGEVLLEVGAPRVVPPPERAVALGIALPGNVKIDEIIDQATQMGVSRVIPLVTGRTVVKLSPERWKAKQGRLRRIALEAAKQCGIGRVPVIDPLTPWKDLLPSFRRFDPVLIAAVEGPHEPLPALLSASKGGEVLVLVGPEGDFTPEELQEARRAGAKPFSLGPTVLRCETAVVAALSLVSFLLREGSGRPGTLEVGR